MARDQRQPHPVRDCKTYPNHRGVNHMAEFLRSWGIDPDRPQQRREG